MSAFGPGVTCKPTLVRYNKTYLGDFTRWTANGTGDTTITAEDTTVGSFFQTTVTNSDNQAGHFYLGDGPITLTNNTSFKMVALVRFDGGTAEVGMGLSDGFSTANTGIFSDTTATMTSQDSILAYKFANSAFWRGEVRNATSATASGASSIAATHAIWYRISVIGEVKTDGIHARFYSADLSAAVAGDNNYYTIGYGSGVSPVAASGVDNLQFGVAFKTSTTTEVIGRFKPLLLEYNSVGT